MFYMAFAKHSTNAKAASIVIPTDDTSCSISFEVRRLCSPVAGRLIRHQKDYGAVIMLDHRYNVLKFRQMTPPWLQPLLKSTAMADAPVLLHKFFAGLSRQNST